MFNGRDDDQRDAGPRPSTVHPNLARAALRLHFPPSYVLVGAWRLFTDASLRGQPGPNASTRLISFSVQRKFISLSAFLSLAPHSSKWVTNLSNDAVFGYKIPFSLSTC
jgi:hypothetical protein